jgi:hypothetical protein
VPALSDNFSYPLTIDYTALAADGSAWNSTFDHSYTRTVLPAPFLLGSTTAERQLAGGAINETSTGSTGSGYSNNTLAYADTKGGSYARNVNSVNTNITHDAESGSLVHGAFWGFPWLKISAEKHAYAPPRLPGSHRRV